MLKKIPISLVMKALGPCMAQVTRVPAPSGASVKLTVLWPSKGSHMSSCMVTSEGSVAPVTEMRPLPTSLLPWKSSTAPGPAAGPL